MRHAPLVSLFAVSTALLLPAVAAAGVQTHADAYAAPRLLARSLGTGAGAGLGINNCADLRTARLSINDRGEVAAISTCIRPPSSTRDYFTFIDSEGQPHQSRLLPLDGVGSRVSTDDSGQFTYAVQGAGDDGVYAFDPSLGYGSSSHRLLTRQPDGACGRQSPTRLPDDRVRLVAEMCDGSGVTSRAVIESDAMTGAGRMLAADSAWFPAGEFDWLSEPGRSANGWIGGFVEHYPPGLENGRHSVMAIHPQQDEVQARSWGSSRNRLPGAVDLNEMFGIGSDGDSAMLFCSGNCVIFLHYMDPDNVIRWAAVPDLEPEGVVGVRPQTGRPPAVRRAGGSLHMVGSMRTLPVATGDDVLVTMGARRLDPDVESETAWEILLREGALVDTDLGPARITRRTGGSAFYGDVVMNRRGDIAVVASLELEATGARIGEGIFLLALDGIFTDGFDES